MGALPLAAMIGCLGLVSQASVAQGPRFPASHANLGSTVYDSAAVDIDADGWPDLIAGSDGLRIRRGLGDGSFGPMETWFGGKAVKGLTIVDVDGDGDLDVVACRSGFQGLIVMWQKPDHTFGALTSYPAIGSPRDTAAGDLNGDGWVDLLVSSASQVQLRLATAPGVFGDALTFPLAPGADDIALADFDQDGHLDLASDCTQAGVVSVRIGDGAGGFGPLMTWPIAPSSSSLLAVDLDADGALDLVVGQEYTLGAFEILYGVGDGSFEPKVKLVAGFNGPQEVAAGDIDRDGQLDLAVAAESRVTLLFGLGSRKFGAPVHYTMGGINHSAISLSDLDLDGWLDIVLDNQVTSDAGVLLAEGGAAFFAADLYDGPSSSNPGIAVADFDGDGVLDVFATNEWTASGTTWLGAGDGSFTAGPTQGTPDVPWSAEAGLLDGDAIPDLLLLDRTTSTANVLIGQGDGSFSAGQVIATGGVWPRASALADLDHDGDLDAVVANETSCTVQVLLGAGDGSFTAGALLGPFAGLNLGNVALGDVTGDGHMDLVLATHSGPNWFLLPGDGAGGFPSTGWLAFGAGDSVADLKLADVNHDGRLDAIHAVYGVHAVRIYLNNGTLALAYFDPATVIPLDPFGGGPSYPDSLALADYDVDGELDIAVAMGAAVRVDLLFGDGSGAFTPRESYAVDESGQYLRTGDWDQDGAPDLIAVAQSLSVLHNNTLDPWKSLGQGHPGFDGIPWLHGDGVPEAGQPFSIHIEHGRPSTPVVLVAGLTTLMVPFKGGTLVPHPDLLLSGLVTDSAGEVSLSGTWPAIPGNPELYLQAWLMDGAADHGLAGSGALRILDQ